VDSKYLNIKGYLNNRMDTHIVANTFSKDNVFTSISPNEQFIQIKKYKSWGAF